MTKPTRITKRALAPDWFVQGVLTKIGDIFDRLLGRGWKPSSSLATSELIERLKNLLDSEVKETPTKAKFVPHNITLKMQWDKFSTDAENALRTLENELLAAAVDHINDRRYFTYAPLSIKVKPDYFTSGVKLYAGFESFEENGREAEVSVSIPGIHLNQDLPVDGAAPVKLRLLAKHIIKGKTVVERLELTEGVRITVGRGKQNKLTIDDPSVSKIHASLTLNAPESLIVADTGSTNGTFVNDIRIAYGKALKLEAGDRVRLGAVDIDFELIPTDTNEVNNQPTAESEQTYAIGEFEFRGRTSQPADRTSGEPKPNSKADLESTVRIAQNISSPTAVKVKQEPEETK